VSWDIHLAPFAAGNKEHLIATLQAFADARNGDLPTGAAGPVQSTDADRKQMRTALGALVHFAGRKSNLAVEQAARSYVQALGEVMWDELPPTPHEMVREGILAAIVKLEEIGAFSRPAEAQPECSPPSRPAIGRLGLAAGPFDALPLRGLLSDGALERLGRPGQPRFVRKTAPPGSFHSP
jgi:hypothetical protein